MAIYQSDQPQSLSALLGQSIGGGLGKGLSTGLEQLTQHKMNQILQQQEAQRLAPIAERLGIPGAEVLGVQGLARLLQQRQRQEYEQGLMNQYNQMGAGITPGGSIQNLIGDGQQPPQEFDPSRALEPGYLESTFGRQPTQQQAPVIPQTEESIRAKYAPLLEKTRIGAMIPSLSNMALREQSNIIQQMNSELEGIRSKEKTALTQEELKLKRQEREQESVIKANAPYNKALEEKLPIAQESKAIAQQMMDIWKTGKVATRLKGKYVPNVLQNQETIEFNRLSDELAKNLIAAMRGPATNFKIRFAQNLKPTSSQDAETQKKTIEHIMDMADKILKEGEIRDQLIAQNKGIEPKQLSARVRKAMKQQGLFGEPKEGQYQEGQVLQDEESGKYYHIANGQPVEVSAERVARGS
jgi:hypothetical protein